MSGLFVASLLMALGAVVACFVEVPFVSNYAFWVLFVAYIMLAGKMGGGG